MTEDFRRSIFKDFIKKSKPHRIKLDQLMIAKNPIFKTLILTLTDHKKCEIFGDQKSDPETLLGRENLLFNEKTVLLDKSDFYRKI